MKFNYIIHISLFIIAWAMLTGCWSKAQEEGNNGEVQIGEHIEENTEENAGESVVDSIVDQAIPQTIYALWDSLTAWYGLPVEQSYPAQLEQKLQGMWYADISVINAGISWDTSEWLLRRLERQLEDAQVDDIAILVIGANDGMRGLPLDQLQENLTQMIDLLLEKQMNVVLGGMQIPVNTAQVYRNEFTQIYKDVCELYTSDERYNWAISCIDFFLEWVWGIPELNLPDGIHPTEEGYGIIVDEVLPYVLPHLDSPA